MSLIKTTTSLIIFCLFITILAYAQTAEDYFNSGLTKSNKQDYKGAIQDYSKAIELDPKLVKAYVNRGLAKANIKDYREAIQDYSKAIELDPKLAKTYESRGLAKANIKDYRGAIQDFTKAIELNPNLDKAYNNWFFCTVNVIINLAFFILIQEPSSL